jgi:hypothetical protein
MSALLDEQTGATREIFARVTGVDADIFSREGVTVSARPEPAPWPFTAMVAGFGTGAVLCVEERYVDWAKSQKYQRIDEAFYAGHRLEAHAGERGGTLHAGPPTLGWALARRPDERPATEGYRLERVDSAWMKEWQPKGLFTNALGTPDQAHRTFRNRSARVLFDPAGQPAAVAGVYDTAGLSEIGVDVRREHRGRGLAPVVVSAVAGDILDHGGVAFYECTVANTRSQRTALASGFMPVCTVALVYAAGLGMA